LDDSNRNKFKRKDNNCYFYNKNRDEDQYNSYFFESDDLSTIRIDPNNLGNISKIFIKFIKD